MTTPQLSALDINEQGQNNLVNDKWTYWIINRTNKEKILWGLQNDRSRDSY